MSQRADQELYAALSLASKGVEKKRALQLARQLADLQGARGIARKTGGFLDDLASHGRELFDRAFRRVRKLLCDGSRPRPLAKAAHKPISLAFEAAAQQLGLPNGMAGLFADIAMAEGLVRLCKERVAK